MCFKKLKKKWREKQAKVLNSSYKMTGIIFLVSLTIDRNLNVDSHNKIILFQCHS